MTSSPPPITKAVILAGGLGTRLAPLTALTPKPILPIGASTILEIQLHNFGQHGFREVYIATNYLHDEVVAKIGDGSAYGVKVVFSREEKRLGTCGPLSLLRAELSEPFVMMNGDILTSIDLTRFGGFALGTRANLTVATKEINIPFRFGRVVAEGDYVTDIEEKPDYKQEVLAGIYAMRPEAIELVPSDTYFGMDDLIKTMMSDRRPVAKYKMREYWVDIGQLDDYEMAKEMFAQKDARAVLSALPEHE